MDGIIQTQDYFKQTFRKLEKIGEGSMGKVHKIENKKTGEIFARKKILITSEEQLSSLFKFMLKYKTLFGGSNFIVQIYFCFYSTHEKTNSRFFNIVMECLGKTLKAQIIDLKYKNEMLTYINILEFLYSMVSGLDLLKKSNSQSHLDIKPQNIMITSDSKFYKLIDIPDKNYSDFPHLSTVTTFGTLNYIAPEMKFLNATDILATFDTFKADIFSLGVTTLELCTLELNIRQKLEENNLLIPLDLRNRISKNFGIEFLCFLEKMVNKNPIHRPTLLDIKEFLFKNNIESLLNPPEQECSLSHDKVSF